MENNSYFMYKRRSTEDGKVYEEKDLTKTLNIIIEAFYAIFTMVYKVYFNMYKGEKFEEKDATPNIIRAQYVLVVLSDILKKTSKSLKDIKAPEMIIEKIDDINHDSIDLQRLIMNCSVSVFNDEDADDFLDGLTDAIDPIITAYENSTFDYVLPIVLNVQKELNSMKKYLIDKEMNYNE